MKKKTIEFRSLIDKYQMWSFVFPYKCKKFSCFNSVENPIGNLLGIVLNL